MKKSIVKMMAEAARAAEAQKTAEASAPAAQPASAPQSTPRSSPPAAPAAEGARMVAPVVSSMGRALSQLKEDSIVALDPGKIDPSPFRDRFAADEEAAGALEELKLSISSEGQKIPVLVRPHPAAEGRYQLAYGHRRLAAVLALMQESGRPETVKIRAYVRPLSDMDLIREQSVENGVRENLTWIEQALWAQQLKEAGFKQRDMQPVLGVTESTVSTLLKVAASVPEDIVLAIGRARNVGRPAWTAFAKLFDDAKAAPRIRAILDAKAFLAGDAPARMALAAKAARGKGAERAPGQTAEQEIRSGKRLLGKLKTGSSGVTLTIPKQEAAFGAWLGGRLEQLYEEFEKDAGGSSEKS
ncbi:plasmid partitioning protein RepB [Pannonibacter indicus]|uniref:Plasmid partitioning protein RepB n=1 Tax=Pannonibacter indicus TaxID=466044 RepID=A0A0K6I835_9HYPH|nr:plasmid partitioning protein RepB [Pannonibacter indicus]CUA99290.1 plasmid partitioning protein RepB [Pannonibacter indicus]